MDKAIFIRMLLFYSQSLGLTGIYDLAGYNFAGGVEAVPMAKSRAQWKHFGFVLPSIEKDRPDRQVLRTGDSRPGGQ